MTSWFSKCLVFSNYVCVCSGRVEGGPCSVILDSGSLSLPVWGLTLVCESLCSKLLVLPGLGSMPECPCLRLEYSLRPGCPILSSCHPFSTLPF